jgi:hypothetical protein
MHAIDSVPVPRTGPVGRLARFLVALGVAYPLYSIADEGGPTSFRDSSNLTEPITWALHVVMLILFVLLAGQLAAATAGPAAIRRWQIRALVGVALVLGAGALTAWIASGKSGRRRSPNWSGASMRSCWLRRSWPFCSRSRSGHLGARSVCGRS